MPVAVMLIAGVETVAGVWVPDRDVPVAPVTGIDGSDVLDPVSVLVPVALIGLVVPVMVVVNIRVPVTGTLPVATGVILPEI